MTQRVTWTALAIFAIFHLQSQFFCLRFWCYIQMGMVVNMQKIRRSLNIQKMGESKTWSLKVLESEMIKSDCMVIKKASMTLELINNTMDGSYWEYSSWLDRIL